MNHKLQHRIANDIDAVRKDCFGDALQLGLVAGNVQINDMDSVSPRRLPLDVRGDRQNAVEKPVLVREYLRYRLGDWETVREHKRKWPRRKRGQIR